jgi:crotonobetainyl-CoA:carnitine CoA-transferase CaiB-like acyl-CoA transferase
MNDGHMAKVPLMPFTLDGERPGIRLQPPRIGEHTGELLREVGYSEEEIAAFEARQTGIAG